MRLWFRWVAANAAGELAGLGLVFACGVTIFGGQTRTAIATTLLLAALLGVLEGATVGFAQWLVLRRWIANITIERWVAATAIGAGAAWTLGMLPSTFMHAHAQVALTTAPPTALQNLIMSVVTGAAGGVVLSFAQWRVLRRAAGGAGWWIPANVAAWVIAMPWIFWLVGSTIAHHRDRGSIAAFLAGLAAAGAIVGAVHGIVLVLLIRPRETQTRVRPSRAAVMADNAAAVVRH
jgi:hypothetical protein